MSSIILNENRIAHFTSSEIYRLTGIGSRDMTEAELEAHKLENPKSRARTIKHLDTPDSKFYTYLDEVRRSKKAKRAMSTDVTTRSTAWGDLMEIMIHKLDKEVAYAYDAKKTTIHPTIEMWSGSTDFISEDCVSEAKGYQIDKGTKYHECLELCAELGSPEPLKEDFEQEYWQILSGACIHGKKYGEAVLYMPYFHDLPKVYETAMNINTDGDIWRYKSICDAIEQDRYAELTYLIEDGEYKDLIRYRFEAPQSDKDFLTERVELAVKLLNEK
jgi:hypothetical protein